MLIKNFYNLHGGLSKRKKSLKNKLFNDSRVSVAYYQKSFFKIGRIHLLNKKISKIILEAC